MTEQSTSVEKADFADLLPKSELGRAFPQLFPRPSSINRFVRLYRADLEAAGALVRFLNRDYLRRQRFEEVLLQLGGREPGPVATVSRLGDER